MSLLARPLMIAACAAALAFAPTPARAADSDGDTRACVTSKEYSLMTVGKSLAYVRDRADSNGTRVPGTNRWKFGSCYVQAHYVTFRADSSGVLRVKSKYLTHRIELILGASHIGNTNCAPNPSQSEVMGLVRAEQGEAAPFVNREVQGTVVQGVPYSFTKVVERRYMADTRWTAQAETWASECPGNTWSGENYTWCRIKIDRSTRYYFHSSQAGQFTSGALCEVIT